MGSPIDSVMAQPKNPYALLRSPAFARRPKAEVITRIEAMIEAIVTDLSFGRPCTIAIQPRQSKLSRNLNEETLRKESNKSRSWNFHGKTGKEAWNFTVALKVIELVHQALVDDAITTKRNIYYKDPGLFVKQKVVDGLVDDLAFTLNVQRCDLNVVSYPFSHLTIADYQPSQALMASAQDAMAKGLVAGPFTLLRNDGSLTNFELEPEGALVPPLSDGDKLDLSRVGWVLIVEKESSFRALNADLDRDLPYERLNKSGILMTGKGYPDFNTRALLHHISITEPMVPIYCLVDWDPDGIAIFWTYAYGSDSLAWMSHALAVPSMTFIGLSSADVVQLANEGLLTFNEKTILPLTSKDRAKANAMLGRACIDEGAALLGMNNVNQPDTDWKHELQIMLTMDKKAEIQIVDGVNGALQDWVMRKAIWIGWIAATSDDLPAIV